MDDKELAAMKQAVVDGDVDGARVLALRAVEDGGDLLAAIEKGFAAGIRRVGVLWEEGEYFLPELVQGAEAMKAALGVLTPALRAHGVATRSRGRVVIGTVRGDQHDIGKSLVATLLATGGFEVHDLGADVAVETFLRAARETNADIIAASALLTTTMTVQRDLVEAVTAAGLAGSLRVLIGGAPTSPRWAEAIGAAYAENALRAVEVAGRLVS